MAPPAGDAEDRRAREMRAGASLKGRYRLLHRIAAGPATEVWTARDKVLDRTVLVKLLRVVAGDTETRERFRREALGVARLSHPGIVAVYDTILDGGITGLVLEHVQATPLSRFLHEGGSVSADEAVSIALQVADALEAAHSNDVRHGNLTSNSVWLCSDQRVKITDFGTAWGHGEVEADDPPQTPTDGEQADIAALGRLLQDCLTASSPPGQLPEALADFVAVARAPAGEPRFASVTEARSRLADAHSLPGTPAGSWPHPAPVSLSDMDGGHDPPREDGRRPRRRLRGLPLVAAAAAAAIAVSVLSLTGGDESPPGEIPGGAPPVAPTRSPASPGETGEPPPSPAGTAGDDSGDGDSAGRAVPSDDPEAGLVTSGEPEAGLVTSGEPEAGLVTSGEPGDADPGVAIVDVRVVMFRPDEPSEGDPDALRTLDGDESTHWATPGLGAGDATVNGVGLEFRLAEPTEVTLMAITSDTTGWVAAVYVGDGDYDRLSDWGPLFDQQTNTTGRMILDLAGEEAAAVLLWIPDPRAAVTDEIHIAEVIISATSSAQVR